MSWLFSQALAEVFSAANCSAGEPCAPSSTTSKPQAFSCIGRTTTSLSRSPSGTTCGLLTGCRGAAVLTWCQAVSRAKHSAAHLEDARWRTISGRKCSASWQMSLPGTSLPRTSPSGPSTGRRTILSRWVTRSDAQVFPRLTWVLTTFGPATGFLHTPTCTANYAAPSMQKWPSAREFVRVFGRPSGQNHEWLMGWPPKWTDCEPLETDKYLSWLRLHGACSADHQQLEVA
jgi:hypothetical protein